MVFIALAKAARFAWTPPLRNPALIFFAVALPNFPTVPRRFMDFAARRNQ
jgi:hypothetical protein